MLVMNVSGRLDRRALETRTLVRSPGGSEHQQPPPLGELASLEELRSEDFLALRNDELEEVTQWPSYGRANQPNQNARIHRSHAQSGGGGHWVAARPT